MDYLSIIVGKTITGLFELLCFLFALHLVKGIKLAMENVYMNIPKMNVTNYESVWSQVMTMARHNNLPDERIITFIPPLSPNVVTHDTNVESNQCYQD